VESGGDLTVKSSGAQGALVDVWEVRLLVEESVEGVVTPVGAVDTSVTTRRLWRLEHALEGSGWGTDSSSSTSKVLIRIFCWHLGLDD
jgi:hypothetical protein